MQIFTSTPDEYSLSLPIERQGVIERLRSIIKENLPEGFIECMNYGMIGYVVPHSLYPAGYHCDPSLPLPFVALANQKHGIHLYHMGIYADPILLEWWEDAYSRENIGKLDMGKSCIRFKNMEKIPYTLIGELCQKITVEAWINNYESKLLK